MSKLHQSIAIAALLAAAGSGHAISLTYSGSGVNPNSGQTVSASVTFEQAVAGADIVVTLTNTSVADVLMPTDVLTAVYFQLAGIGALTPKSALLAPGSSVLYDPDGQPIGGVVGGEWAYLPTYGISSVGIGLFGPGDRFPGSDLAPPVSPDGLQYGIVSAGDNAATGNAAVTGSGGLIRNSVVFTLQSTPGYLLAGSSLSGVAFQYGTSLTEPVITAAVPEPAAALMLSGGLGALALAARPRRSRKGRSA